MAITCMTSADRAHLPNVVTITDYPGHEAGLMTHGDSCPHYGQRDLSGAFSAECIREGSYSARCTGPFEPLYMETTHVGLVLDTGEYNGYDDSDFYAVVWNPETRAPERVTYASTRGWTYPNHAEVDATPETLAAYAAFCEAARQRAAEAREAAEALRVAKGKRIRVARGRKVPKGTEGTCIWLGDGAWGPRVGLRDDAGAVHWTAAKNVEVIL